MVNTNVNYSLCVSIHVCTLFLFDDAKVQKKSMQKEFFLVYSLIFLEMLKCKEIIQVVRGLIYTIKIIQPYYLRESSAGFTEIS